MAVISYNEWEFDVDVDKTWEYYNKLVIDNSSQVSRNYKKYCESLTKDEKEFFDKFGIIPEKGICDFIDIEKKNISFSGCYYVFAKVIKEPIDPFGIIEENVEPQEDNEEVEDIDVEDNDVYIGAFDFSFYNVHDEDEIPEDMPQGCIMVHFICEDMQWLLEEKCEYVSCFPPRFWEINKRIKLLKNKKKELKEYIDKQERKLVNNSIKYTRLSKNEIKKYKRRWIKTFTPSELDMRKVRKICYGECNYLWHLFSFECVECIENGEAEESLNKVNKDVVLLFDNINNIGYQLRNVSNLIASFLDEWTDVTIVDLGFTWTYSKTHEYGLGPYYYER